MHEEESLRNLADAAEGLLVREAGERGSRMVRRTVPMSIEVLEDLPESSGLWHESEADIEKEEALGRVREELLAWVRGPGASCLTDIECNYLVLHFFGGLGQREIAEQTGRSFSSVSRGLGRALKKLRKVARHNKSLNGLRRAWRLGPEV